MNTVYSIISKFFESTFVRVTIVALYIFTITSCSKDNDEYTMFGLIFYENEKIWKHKVNESEEVNKYLDQFPGIELDVHYNGYRDNFYITHDKGYDVSETETLNQYFNKIQDVKKYYYWIDFKNLSFINDGKAIDRLNKVLNNHNIKNNCIVESTNADKLKKFNDEGFFTSYWVPAHGYDGTLNDQNKEDIKEIEDNLEKCVHNAISSHAENAQFFYDHFPSYNLHVWTNNWDTTNLELFNNLLNYPNIKVILVDKEISF